MTERERPNDVEEQPAPVHGGEGDPLGEGVADLEDSDGVTEGEPKQD